MSNNFQEVLADEVREILSRPDDRSDSNHLKAVRHVRNSTGFSLKEAREFIDRIRGGQQAGAASQVVRASEELLNAIREGMAEHKVQSRDMAESIAARVCALVQAKQDV